MSQFDFIKDITKFGLENDQEKLSETVMELIEHSRNTKKLNFALELQSILKDARLQASKSKPRVIEKDTFFNRLEDREIGELVLEKLTSNYSFGNLISNGHIQEELRYFLEEHSSVELLRRYELPIANKVLLHGPSGCGKTLASYVIAGELKKTMLVVNLGAVVSSKLGETSKNITKIFRKASDEDSIIFIDEFDSLGKVRDYSQDHGEMKRVVNTILQLFDYLPQTCLLIAATNQKDMLDEALLRRFDLSLELGLPNTSDIKALINLTLKDDRFVFDKPRTVDHIVEKAVGLSYYSIQKTLVTAIKRSLLHRGEENQSKRTSISTELWSQLLENEKLSLKR